MKDEQIIAVLSDSHDARKNLEWALSEIRDRGIREIIHCGDLRSSAILDLFEGLSPLFVLGNADRQVDTLRAEIRGRFGARAVGYTRTLERAGKRIGVTHGHTPDLEKLIESGDYDYVFHGHTHRRRDELVGRTRVINPGAIGGMKRESRSFVLFNPAADQADFVEMPD
jgi:hypothetical protein